MRKNILYAKVKIQGLRPALWHHFGPEALPLEKQERTGVAGHDPEEWRRTVLMDKNRQLYWDPTYIFGSIRNGAKFTKKGKSSMMSAISSTLQVVDNRIYIKDRFVPEEPIPTDPDNLVYMDIRSCRNPSTGARNIRYRVATAPGWECEFTIMWDKTIIARQMMEAILYDTGQFSGLGDGRSIGFGRFEVISFAIVDGNEEEADGIDEEPEEEVLEEVAIGTNNGLGAEE